MKNIILLIVLGFALTVWACAGPTRLRISQCKEVTSTEKECMTFEVDGEASILPL